MVRGAVSFDEGRDLTRLLLKEWPCSLPLLEEELAAWVRLRVLRWHVLQNFRSSLTNFPPFFSFSLADWFVSDVLWLVSLLR